MRILHICDGIPSAQSPGGGHVFFWQNLAALSELGHEVHLVACNTRGPVEEDVVRRVASVTYAVPVEPGRRSLDHWLAKVFREETLLFRFRDWRGLGAQVHAAFERVRPDVIWADHMFSMLVAPRGAPVIYGHLDFIHQLQAVRQGAAKKKRLRRPDVVSRAALERLELEAVRRASVAVSVSSSDRALFDRESVPSVYVPVVGESIARPSVPAAGPARGVLLGRSNTAMNTSRRNLRDDIWQHLDQDRLRMEWHQVGEPPAKADDAWRWVEQHFVVHGYTRDLGSVLRMGDLCLVPYRDDTGFRAKFVTAAGYGMVNIGYAETYRCAEEFVPGENCLAATSGEHFAELISAYAQDHAQRRRLSEASRALYEAKFGLASHLPTYSSILERALRRGDVNA